MNEDPTEKLIRELRQENERLKKMLDKGAMDVPIQPGMTEDGTILITLFTLVSRKINSLYTVKNNC